MLMDGTSAPFHTYHSAFLLVSSHVNDNINDYTTAKLPNRNKTSKTTEKEPCPTLKFISGAKDYEKQDSLIHHGACLTEFWKK